MISEVFPMAVPLWKRDGSIRAYALVDADDYADVAGWRWYGVVEPTGIRVARMKEGRQVVFARELLGLSWGDPREADHINGDTLDNRRSNLRATNHDQNQQNRRGATKRSRSGVRGVHWHGGTGRWQAEVRRCYLGLYDTIEEAEAVVVAYRREHMTHSEMDKPS